MLTSIRLQDLRLAIFRYRQERGRYLLDIDFAELDKKELQEIAVDASLILTRTQLDVRRVRRGRTFVWRIVNRNGL
jgi:hypothetical protein